MDVENNRGTERLTLTGDMNIYDAAELKNTLLNALNRCERLDLDLAQVNDIDTAGLQILLLAKREASRREKSLRIVAHSAAVRDVFDFCHMAAYFGDPVVIPAREQQ